MVHVGVIMEETMTALASTLVVDFSLGLVIGAEVVTTGEVTDFLGDDGDVLGGVVTLGCM